MSAFFVEFIHSFAELMSPAGLAVLGGIIFIDLVMSGDNAIIIGVATAKLGKSDRKKAIFWWVVLATVLRICFAMVATKMLGVLGLKLAWGILLLYVAYKLFKTVHFGESHDDLDGKKPKKEWLRAAIISIIIADFSMSLDNVLAVAWAAKENLAALGIGLVVSIVLMAFASNLVAGLLEKFPKVQYLGIAIIGYIACEMIYRGGIDVVTAVAIL